MRYRTGIQGFALLLVLAPQPALATIIDGGTVFVNGTSTVFSDPLVIGATQTGGMQVLNSGNAFPLGNTTLGRDAGASGSLVVDGLFSYFRPWGGSTVTVGDAGAGSVTVQNEGGVTGDELPSPRTVVGNQATGSGHVTLTGSGSLWYHSGGLVLGRSGSAVYEVLDGAQGGAVGGRLGELAGSSGRLTVSGVGSRWLEGVPDFSIGIGGFGRVEILDGATSEHRFGSNHVVLGVDATGEGELLVSGAGSSFDQGGNFTIGGAGSGLVEVQDQAELAAVDVTLGNQAGAIGILRQEGAGTVFDPTGTFTIGNAGDGRFELGGGAVSGAGFSFDEVHLGFAPGSSGHAEVEGAGTRWLVASGMDVGRAGQGDVWVNSGASVWAQSARLGTLAGSDGSVLVEGPGTSWSSQSLDVGLAGTGSFLARDGAVVGIGNLVVGENGTFELDGASLSAVNIEVQGRLVGDGTITGPLTNRGEVGPGHSPGTIDVQGSYTQDADGLLEIEIVGAAAGEFDLLLVSGNAVLDGVLSVHLLGDPFALMGIRIDFLEASSISGGFSQLQATGIDPGMLELDIQADRASITVIPEPASALLLAGGLAALCLVARRSIPPGSSQI